MAKKARDEEERKMWKQVAKDVRGNAGRVTGEGLKKAFGHVETNVWLQGHGVGLVKNYLMSNDQ